ncbi:MAG TPA: cytochrome c oxidase assembly protein [Hanamia sp.]|nr:cytochrome c oxidase assembly protein [Hanamia sp.]
MNALLSYWSFDPLIILFIILNCLLYLFTVRFKIASKAYYFLGAILLILLCETSPLNFLGENYLFSAHMLSHMLIVLLAGPLIVASLPAENRFQKQLIFFSNKIARAPIIAWLCGVANMWFWHIPSIFNRLFMMNGSASALMFLHFLILLLAGMLFSWPIINPYKKSRLKPLAAVIYLSTACVFCSLLGLIITFSHIGTYTPYLNITDRFGFLPLIRNKWNISVSVDQQMAGLIMWVPGCFIYLSASMVLLIKWFGGKEEAPTIEGLIKV